VKKYLEAYRRGRGWLGQNDIKDRLEMQQSEFMYRIKFCKRTGLKITRKRMSAILDLSPDGGLSRGKGSRESARSVWRKVENAKPQTDATEKVVTAVIKGFTDHIYTNDWKGGQYGRDEEHLMLKEGETYLNIKSEDSEAVFDGVTPSYWPYTLTRSLIKGRREHWRKQRIISSMEEHWRKQWIISSIQRRRSKTKLRRWILTSCKAF
jgi:hypothetical protein